MTAWFSQGGNREVKPLNVSEWGRFARWLKSKNLTPGCLMKGLVRELLGEFQDRSITPERVESLLARGAALALCMEKWERAGIWVMTRSAPDYPSALKLRLKQNSIFGCGDRLLLNGRSLAVVGSRKVGAEGLAYSALLGSVAAREDCSIVSGGAAGVDEAAMFGSLLGGGKAVGVLPASLLNTCLKEKYRGHIMDGRLVLISPYSPEAGFSAGNAMQRNLLHVGRFVVHSATWSGRESQTLGQALGEGGRRPFCREFDLDNLQVLHDDHNIEKGAQMEYPCSYDSFLERQELCNDTERRSAELGELIPVRRSRLNAWLKQAVSEETGKTCQAGR